MSEQIIVYRDSTGELYVSIDGGATAATLRQGWDGCPEVCGTWALEGELALREPLHEVWRSGAAS